MADCGIGRRREAGSVGNPLATPSCSATPSVVLFEPLESQVGYNLSCACAHSPLCCMGTHRRERVTRPGRLYCLFLQGFAHPFISDTFPQVSKTGSSDGKTEAKRASTRPFSCTSASAEGQNGNTDLVPAVYRVTSQLPFCRSFLCTCERLTGSLCPLEAGVSGETSRQGPWPS
jgi:hypothetical protein